MNIETEEPTLMSYEERVEELSLENDEALTADGFESALIGVTYRNGIPPIAAYDYDKCLDILMAGGMEYEDAVEYMDFNVLGAYVGDGTPAFVRFFKK